MRRRLDAGARRLTAWFETDAADIEDFSTDMRQDLAALEQRWGLALESAGFGVWDLDVAAQTVRCSPQ